MKRLLAFGFTTALAAPWLLAATASGPKTIEVERIVLRDSEGRIRAELATGEDHTPFLTLFDEGGAPAARLHGGKAGPILEMSDGQGGTTWLSASRTGSALSLSKGQGEIELAATASGQPTARLQDGNGKVLWTAP